MSACCNMSIEVHSSDEDFQKILAKLFEIEKANPMKLAYNPTYPFVIKDHTIHCDNGACRNVWGSNYLDPEIDMFLDLAQAAPDASFEVNSSRVYEGGGGGCETYLKAEYKDRKLIFKLQPYVDTMSLTDLVGSGFGEIPDDEIFVAIAGRMKYHDTINDLEDYLNIYDVLVMTSVSNKTHYVICNDPNSTCKAVVKAKELNIPIISEAAAIRMFGDAYDFDDPEALTQDVTYEEFCKYYKVDDTVTKEEFEQAQKDGYGGFIVWNDNKVSMEGPWNESQYYLDTNNHWNTLC